MEENSTPPTTYQKSEYTQRVEVVAKELMGLVQSKINSTDSTTGIIIISVNTEKDADKDEVVISTAGIGKSLRLGLKLFAEQDPKMAGMFDSVAGERALMKLLEKLK